MQRNLRLYSAYQIGISFYAWMPVFFLYFQSKFSLAQVLLLESVYYVSVFLLEVPSGYFSDRVGRKPTLLVASATLLLSYLVFFFGVEFWHFVAAQILLATGLAFNSGTDTTFHLDTLTDLGRAEEYAEREAKLSGLTFLVGAASSLAGGALGAIGLEWAYGASAVFACLALLSALGFREPHHGSVSSGISETLKRCWRVTRDSGFVRWIGMFWVAAVVVNHLPYEFYQPYFARVGEAGFWGTTSTSMFSGAHAAVVQLVAAGVAAYSVRFSKRVGFRAAMMMSLGIQTAVTASMWVVSPLIAVVLVLRALPRAMQDAPLRAALAPRIPGEVRATYLSILSLAGRLSFAGVLVGLSWVASDGALQTTIGAAAACAFALWVLVGLAAVGVKNDDQTSQESPSQPGA